MMIGAFTIRHQLMKQHAREMSRARGGRALARWSRAVFITLVVHHAATTAQHLKKGETTVGFTGQDGRVPEPVNSLRDTDRCTTITVGKKATADGSVMTTHTNDCGECDFRIAKVPARDWPEGSMRPILLFSSTYPRKVMKGRGHTWDPSNLEKDLPQREHWNESYTKVIGHIPQVRHTYALIEGTYGIMNEHQVAIGESTCPGRFYTKPQTQGGRALLELSELTSIGLERCNTARCAVETMGRLAEKYGYYGQQWDGNLADVIVEAGEALSVTDPHEAWIFHITPDDTGRSAIWVAQRVPDDHITIVANQFTIRAVKKGDPDFLYSKNLWHVAKKHKLWNPDDGDLDFLKVYGVKRLFPTYSTRRMWRVFTLAAPSLSDCITGEVDAWADGYPFSVKPDKPITPQDLMRYQRDHFEGTKYDMTKGVAAGPYGNPNRYDVAPRPQEGVTMSVANGGMFERSISLFRTSYSIVTQSRAHVRREVGARVWFCQYMPSMSAYTPVYVAAPELPEPFTVGSLFKYTKRSFWWASAMVGNWASRFYMHIRTDVEAKQAELEAPLEQWAGFAETVATALMAEGRVEEGLATLQEFSNAAAYRALDTFNQLFEHLIAKYRDGYRVVDLVSPTLQLEYLFYPLWWLKVSGFFDNKPTSVFKDEGTYCATPRDLDRLFEAKIERMAAVHAMEGSPAPPSSPTPSHAHSTWARSLESMLLMALMSALSLIAGVWIGRRQMRRGYVTVGEAERPGAAGLQLT